MSMNWREIDAVLSEWNLDGCRLQRVRQPDYRRIILEFSRPGHKESVESVVQAPFVRIHRLSAGTRLPNALPRPPRFTAVLKSRVEGARLRSAVQLGRDRIVRFDFDAAEGRLYLDVKLWGGGANIILASSDGTVIDAFSRRPKRGEAPGEPWPPEGIGIPPRDETPSDGTDAGHFAVRNLPGTGDWNQRVEAHYRREESDADTSQTLRLWDSYLARREAALAAKARRLEENFRRFEARNGDGHWADLIMAHLHRLNRGDEVLEAEDWENPGSTVRIPLDATMGPRENAERYYNRQKRSVRAIERLKEDREALERTQGHVDALRERLASGDTDSSPFDGPPPAERRSGGAVSELPPGLWIRKDPYIIAVGRNAKESDYLLRRWAKGNDTWLHARDWPGGHVFVRAPRGKSIPLDILLDAGNLALSYSKGRSAREADLYYTQVKNLRRAKDGPAGTVLPTREKNLRVRLDTSRLESLKAAAESG